MDIIERLQIMEAIWDSLLYDEVEMESPTLLATGVKSGRFGI